MSPALLIIDVQTALFHEEGEPADAAAVITRINALASRARARGVPVIVIQHEVPGGTQAYGTPGWQNEPRLDVRPTDLLVRKTTPDSFLRTNLSQVLADAKVDHLVICGYASEFCIDTTVSRAASLGFPVTLVSDAHTTHDKPHLSAALIRAHENATLPDIGSFGPVIEAKPAEGIWCEC